MTPPCVCMYGFELWTRAERSHSPYDYSQIMLLLFICIDLACILYTVEVDWPDPL